MTPVVVPTRPILTMRLDGRCVDDCVEGWITDSAGMEAILCGDCLSNRRMMNIFNGARLPASMFGGFKQGFPLPSGAMARVPWRKAISSLDALVEGAARMNRNDAPSPGWRPLVSISGDASTGKTWALGYSARAAIKHGMSVLYMSCLDPLGSVAKLGKGRIQDGAALLRSVDFLLMDDVGPTRERGIELVEELVRTRMSGMMPTALAHSMGSGEKPTFPVLGRMLDGVILT